MTYRVEFSNDRSGTWLDSRYRFVEPISAIKFATGRCRIVESDDQEFEPPSLISQPWQSPTRVYHTLSTREKIISGIAPDLGPMAEMVALKKQKLMIELLNSETYPTHSLDTVERSGILSTDVFTSVDVQRTTSGVAPDLGPTEDMVAKKKIQNVLKVTG